MGSIKAMEALGIEVKDTSMPEELGLQESSEDDRIKHVDEIKNKPPIYKVRQGTSELAVQMGLVPAAYKDAEYDVQHIRDNIVAQIKASKRRFKVIKFDSYISTLNTIISSIKSGVRLDCSHIIGSPNGFGKTSFVNTCLKVMLDRNWCAVPYISLSELAEIRVENERRLMARMNVRGRWLDLDDGNFSYDGNGDIVKVPHVVTGRYSWSEYMNSDILFCFFTTVDSKVIESYTLKAVLDTRSAKGLPTVAFISTSLSPYTMDSKLREYIWDEIMSYKEDKGCFDRVYHTSCYKVASNIIGDEETGIENV